MAPTWQNSERYNSHHSLREWSPLKFCRHNRQPPNTVLGQARDTAYSLWLLHTMISLSLFPTPLSSFTASPSLLVPGDLHA